MARNNRAKEDNQDADAESFELIFKFRCCGSDGYLARVDNTLQVRDTAIERLGAESYHLHVFDRPNERHVAIETRTAESRTRVFACSSVALEQKEGLKGLGHRDRRDLTAAVNLNQHGSLWIVAKYSIVQVSCIHTSQGPEVHYKGVITGPDLVIRDGEVRTVPATRDCHYRSIRSHKTGISTDPVAVTCETHPTIKDS